MKREISLLAANISEEAAGEFFSRSAAYRTKRILCQDVRAAIDRFLYEISKEGNTRA